MSEKSHFEKLAGINVGEKIEKKNGLSYLSWAFAVDQLLRQDPMANWEYREPARWGDTVMVFCTVTAFGKAMTAQLPVMDYKNKAIANPDAFAVNTAMQRCLAKAIALHGLGLYIYAGEDLPEEDAEAKKPKSSGSATKIAFDSLSPDMQIVAQDKANEILAAYAISVEDATILYEQEENDATWRAAIWGLLPSDKRAAMKKFNEEKRAKQ